MSAMRIVSFCLLTTGSCLLNSSLHADEAKSIQEKTKEIAGTAEFLRGVPKHSATLKAVDAARRQVTLLIEGETVPKVWPVVPDAEIKIAGWWGRLDQFTLGDRVWLWFKTDRGKQPVAIAMLADEASEQDTHGLGVTLEARDLENHSLRLKPVKGPSRSLRADKVEAFRGTEKAALESFPVSSKVYVQSTGNQARLLLDSVAFEARRAEQKKALRQRWITGGLPGTAAFLHTFSGELDLILDHEAMRWGRSLKPGDKVTLQATPPIAAVVKTVQPWRERTQLRLVVNSFDQAELTVGQRLFLRMPAPTSEVEQAAFPPDLDQPRSKSERIEWFLASIYCTCKVAGDGCTGHFYTLASCNPNACGMPNHMRQIIAGKIDKGLNDRKIFEELLKEQGPDLLRPHLMP